jgi:hypothetical protein
MVAGGVKGLVQGRVEGWERVECKGAQVQDSEEKIRQVTVYGNRERDGWMEGWNEGQRRAQGCRGEGKRMDGETRGVEGGGGGGLIVSGGWGWGHPPLKGRGRV